MKTAVQVLLSERVIAFNPLLADIAGDVKGGLFLSQCCFMSTNISKDDNGWFYATDAQWYDSARLVRSEITRVRKTLIKLGVLYYKVRGQAHKTYYRIDWERLEQLILDQVGISTNNEQVQETNICKSELNKKSTTVRNSQLQVQETHSCKREKVTSASVRNSHTKRESKKELRENLKNNTSAEKDSANVEADDGRGGFSALVGTLAKGRPIRAKIPTD